MRREKTKNTVTKIGRILPVLIFSIFLIMAFFVYEGYSRDCKKECPHYKVIYESTNLTGHVAYIEENPGGGTNCPVPAVPGEDAIIIPYDYFGEVVANPKGKNIWVNAIGAKKFMDKFPDGTDIVLGTYRYSGEFRLPKLPAPDDTQVENSEAVHFMIQLFDGPDTILPADNYSMEFSILWKINPWTDDYGKVFVYTGVSDDIYNPLTVVDTQVKLDPDLEWHCFEMIVDFKTLKWLSITIDDVKVNLCDVDAAKVKHNDWGDDFFLCITTESQPSWPQHYCSNIYTWTTQFRNLEFGYWPDFTRKNKHGVCKKIKHGACKKIKKKITLGSGK